MKHKLMSVSQFLSYQPSLNQLYEGKIQIAEGRVEEIRNDVLNALRNATHPIVVDSDRMKIISGHHRFEAAKREVAEGTLDLNATFVVTVKNGLSMEHFSREVYEANNGTASGRVATHATFSRMPISVKVINPIFQAVKSASPSFPTSQAQRLARVLGAVFNNNPTLVNALKAGGYIDGIQDMDLYNAKSLDEANKNFHRVVANVDLRPYSDRISTLIKPFVTSVSKFRDEGLWKEKIGNTTNINYVLLAMALRGEFRESGIDVLTPKKLQTALSRYGHKIRKYSKSYQDNPERYSGSIREVLLPEALAA